MSIYGHATDADRATAWSLWGHCTDHEGEEGAVEWIAAALAEERRKARIAAIAETLDAVNVITKVIHDHASTLGDAACVASGDDLTGTLVASAVHAAARIVSETADELRRRYVAEEECQ